MPNHKGYRQPNGSWDEKSPERRRQRAEASRRYRRKHKRDPRYLATHWRSVNKWHRKHWPELACQRDERKFRTYRWTATENTLDQLGLRLVTRASWSSPSFLFISTDGRKEFDYLESLEAMEARLRRLKMVA